MIWAQDSCGGIGLNGKMAWYLPEDFRHFKNMTTDKTVIMGRKTWEGLPKNARPLSNRNNVVLSSVSDEQFLKRFPGAKRLNFDQIVALSEHEDVFIIGGASVYEQFMCAANELIVTELSANYEVDAYAPRIPAKFELVHEGDWKDSNQEKDGEVVRWRVLIYNKFVQVRKFSGVCEANTDLFMRRCVG